MCEPAVMRKRENRTAESSQHVEIGRLGGQRHRRRGECSPAIETDPSHARAGKKMRDRFHDPPMLPVEMKNENTTPAAFPVHYAFSQFNVMAKRTLAIPADKQEIVGRLAKIQSSSPRLWGKMTAPQMICHLADSFRVTMGEKPWKTERISVTPIPLPGWFVKWVALQVPLQWPHGTPTRPEVDSEKGGTPPGVLEGDVRDLLRLLDRFTRQPRDFSWQPHPIFGAMTDAEWMRWGYLHTDHHLRQFGA